MVTIAVVAILVVAVLVIAVPVIACEHQHQRQQDRSGMWMHTWCLHSCKLLPPQLHPVNQNDSHNGVLQCYSVKDTSDLGAKADDEQQLQ